MPTPDNSDSLLARLLSTAPPRTDNPFLPPFPLRDDGSPTPLWPIAPDAASNGRSLLDALTKPSPPTRINPFLPDTANATAPPQRISAVTLARLRSQGQPAPVVNRPLALPPNYREIGPPRYDTNGVAVPPPADRTPRRYFTVNGLQ